MNYLSSVELFKKEESAVLVGVYTDKITVSSIKMDEKGIVVTATAMEPQEGSAFLEGSLDVERIVLNCRKALAALPHSEGGKPHDVIFALGGGVGTFSFTREKSIREEKEKKISAQEVAALVGTHTSKDDKEVTGVFTENFLIDGFAVSDPVGMHGGEMIVGVSRVVCAGALAQGLTSAAADAGLSVRGFADMRYVAAHHGEFYEKERQSAIVLCVFESETTAILVRDRKIAGVGIVGAGYGILTTATEKSFSVGREEAKGIMRALAQKELDAHAHERALTACDAASGALTAEIARDVARLDPMSLLPGNIRVVLSENIIQVHESLGSPAWFASLPIERNATVNVVSIKESEGFLTPFEYIIAKSL